MSREILDRAVKACLSYKDSSGHGAFLLQRKETFTALLIEATGERIIFYYGSAEPSPSELVEELVTFVRLNKNQGSPTFFVLSTDEVTAQRAIREAKPTFMPVPLGFYNLGESGALTHRVNSSKWLEAACETIWDAEPFHDAEVAGELRRTRALASEQANIEGKLKGRYTVTAVLTAICVALFLMRVVWDDGGELDHLRRMGADSGPLVKAGEIWRLLASAFLHGNIVHLGANMIALWSFGTILEALLGPRRYLVLYGASALAGSLASSFLSSSPRLSVGASGAIWGLMAAGIAFVYRPQGLLPPSMLAAARSRAWAPLAINLVYSFQGGVDLLAHIGGGVMGAGLFLSGMITRGLPPLGSAPVSRRNARSEQPLWNALAGGMALAMGLSIAAALVTGKPWDIGAPPKFVNTAVADTGVTLYLPERIVSEPDVDRIDVWTNVRYGNGGGDPIMVLVSVSPLPAAISAEALEGELIEKQKMVRRMPDDATRNAGPSIETVGDKRVVVDELTFKNGVHAKRYFVLLGTKEIMVVVYDTDTKRPSSWSNVEETIVRSLKAS